MERGGNGAGPRLSGAIWKFLSICNEAWHPRDTPHVIFFMPHVEREVRNACFIPLVLMELSQQPHITEEESRARQAEGGCEGQKGLETGNSLVVQWLGLRTFTAVGLGSIPGRGTKIPHAA